MHIESQTITCVDGINTIEFPITNTPDNPAYLLGVQIEEYYPAKDQTEYDTGNIWIYQNDSALSLVAGWMRSGTLQWTGALPLYAPWKIHGQVWHARANNTLKLNIMLGTKAESLGQGGGPGMGTMPVFPAGRLMVVSTSPGANVTAGALYPLPGKIWTVIEAHAYHDDTTARAITWGYYEDGVTFTKTASAAIAANVRWPLALNAGISGLTTLAPLTISNRVYPTFSVPALTAGKKLTVEALVQEYASD